MPADPVPDLNQTIATAVQARVEAEVLKALSGDEMFASLVAASMNALVEVPDGAYSKKRITFMEHVLQKTIQKATQAAVQAVVDEQQDRLKEMVRKGLCSKIDAIATTLVDKVVENSKSPYGWDIKVDVKFPRDNG